MLYIMLTKVSWIAAECTGALVKTDFIISIIQDEVEQMSGETEKWDKNWVSPLFINKTQTVRL